MTENLELKCEDILNQTVSFMKFKKHTILYMHKNDNFMYNHCIKLLTLTKLDSI